MEGQHYASRCSDQWSLTYVSEALRVSAAEPATPVIVCDTIEEKAASEWYTRDDE